MESKKKRGEKVVGIGRGREEEIGLEKCTWYGKLCFLKDIT